MPENLPEQNQSQDSEMEPAAKRFFKGVVYLAVGASAYYTNMTEIQPTSRLGAFAGAICIGMGVTHVVRGLSEESTERQTK